MNVPEFDYCIPFIREIQPVILLDNAPSTDALGEHAIYHIAFFHIASNFFSIIDTSW